MAHIGPDPLAVEAGTRGLGGSVARLLRLALVIEIAEESDTANHTAYQWIIQHTLVFLLRLAIVIEKAEKRQINHAVYTELKTDE
jgi:hypothetical protein